MVQEFYLNYVGCKDWKYKIMFYKRNMFYLNYVGCKGHYTCNYCKKQNRFTLTMWDVKKLEQMQSYAEIEVLP